MIKLLTDQAEATRGFRRWVDAMVGASTATDYGWVVQGSGVVFSNYGHGAPGEIADQVMLGVDPEFGSGIVKIVRPATAQRAKGKLTLIGRDGASRLKLLREGRLHKNAISKLVRDDFARLSGLAEVPVSAGGELSERHWYVVADLDAPRTEIVAQTVRFANACTRARSRAGGGAAPKAAAAPGHGYGMDERGGITTVTREGGTAEVVRLQGFVFEALKKAVGPILRKPSRDRFCVDGMIAPADLLIEIKTGVSPHTMYEAVGQLQLYPSLIGLPDGLERALLVPDDPAIKPAMGAALERAGVVVYTYSLSPGRRRPKVTFPEAFLSRCRRRALDPE